MHAASARVRDVRAAACGLALALACAGSVPASTRDSGDVRWGDTVTVAGDRAGWGRLARLRDGTWLAVTTRFHADAPTTLDISESRDRART